VNEPNDRGAEALPNFDLSLLTELDVRSDLREGREPLARILMIADALPPSGLLHVRAPFFPAPLVQLLAERGFAHRSESFGDDDWSTWFWRGTAPPRAAAPDRSTESVAPVGVLDLRDLPPPEPLLAILARIARSDGPFDVLLPFDPPILDALLAPMEWIAERIADGGDGARLRIRPIRGSVAAPSQSPRA